MGTRRGGRAGRLSKQMNRHRAKAPLVERLEPRQLLATITVNSTLDVNERDTVLTLREAILVANGTVLPTDLSPQELAQFDPATSLARDTIAFNIPEAGVQTIFVGSATGQPLPDITDSVLIDGYTQPLASPNTLAVGHDAVLLVELNGTSAGSSADGLAIAAGGSAVRGLVINQFAGSGISLETGGNNLIEGNFIGTDPSGTADLGNAVSGVSINDAPGNTVGGTAAEARNVLSGNDFAGIDMINPGAMGNVIQGNYIGTDATGNADLGNTFDGINVSFLTGSPTSTPSNNLIGGSAPGARNVISGNDRFGIVISAPVGGGSGNVIQGNYIGTDASGAADRGNGDDGIVISDSGASIPGTASNNQVLNNVISGNDDGGIQIEGPLATGNVVAGNFIGTDATGTIDLGNQFDGVQIFDASANTIGGTAPGAGNVISGNDEDGIDIGFADASGNVVQGNLIGTDASGTAALGNSFMGVRLSGAVGTTVGGLTESARNVISGNGADGVAIQLAGSGNLIAGNSIGVDSTGTVDLGNLAVGVDIFDGATANTVGGTDAGARNIISGNQANGVVIFGAGTSGNLVLGNYIGTDSTGTLALGNALEGVVIQSSSSNTIGGLIPGSRNVISGNALAAVAISALGGPQATGNVVAGNYLGTNAAGNAALGNSTNGVVVLAAESNTIGGDSAAARNVISGNGGDGILFAINSTALFTSRNVVAGNFIGTDSTGTLALGNGGDGVRLGVNVLDNTIGGETAGHRNVIAGNTGGGVHINAEFNPFFGVATGNVVAGNFIGTDAAGTLALGNSLNGVTITPRAESNTVGGTTAGARNLISGGNATGVLIDRADANLIAGNFIGTDVTGTLDLGNGVGISIQGSSDNTIGGVTAGSGNLISGNGGAGLIIASPPDLAATGNLVSGNAIVANGGPGVLLTGFGTISNLLVRNTIGDTIDIPRRGGNGAAGVRIEVGASENTIGGSSPNGLLPGGNTIAGNAGDGVEVVGTIALFAGTGNAILGNSIFDNGGLGIDLGGDGVTPNDPGDPDLGPNALQNFPDLASATSDGGVTTVVGTLESIGSTTFTIQFFASDAVDPSGYGEGQQFLGQATVTTDASGFASFAIPVATPAGSGQFITATATDPAGNTSEFSIHLDRAADLTIIKAAPEAVLLGDSLTYTLTVTNVGPALASGVVVTDALPPGFRFSSVVTSRGTASASDGVVTVGVGGLAPGESATITIVGIAVAVGTLTNTAMVTSRTPDTDPDNDIAEASTLVIDVGADLSIAKIAPSVVEAGGGLTYTLTVSNGGPSLAPGVVVIDALPAGFLLSGITSSKGTASTANGVVTVAVGDLAPGESATITIVGIASGAGFLDNVASAASSTTDPDPTNNTATTTTEILVSFVVINTNDSGPGSLRQAILNANAVPGLDTITFEIPVGQSHTIQPLSPLPTIIDSVNINALSQAGARVEVDGSLAGPEANGLVVVATAGGSSVDGLAINRFAGSGIILVGAGGHRIHNNFIGTDAQAEINLGNGNDGISVLNSAGNLIEGNVLSGNRDSGVRLNGAGSTGNLIVGNLIGTNFNGVMPIGNHNAGVLITGGADGNTVGGPSEGQGNVLSANRTAGVVILGTPDPTGSESAVQVATTAGNLIAGNMIGVAAGAPGTLPNGVAGVLISESAGNTVGGAAPGLTNVIAGGFGAGVYIVGARAAGNLVAGNAIGTRPDAGPSLGGSGSGVVIEYGANANTVGGDRPGAGNTISANAAAGVLIGNASVDNAVLGNRIGSFNQAAGNGVGVLIQTAAARTLVQDNLIGGNVYGMVINPTASRTLVIGNVIGRSQDDGTAGNALVGLTIRDASDNTVGGGGPLRGNIISGNGTLPGNEGASSGLTPDNGVGLLIEGASATGNRVLGNAIGMDRSGQAVVANTSIGLFIDGGRQNIIGGLAPGEQNLISGNGTVGVAIRGLLASGNVVAGNLIGTRLGGEAPAPNNLAGVYIDNAPGNIIGGLLGGAGNVISGNGVTNLQLTGPGASANLVAGNIIGTGPRGEGSLRAAPTGIFLEGAPNNTIGGTTVGAGNLVSGHMAAGIQLVGPGASGNVLQGNRIGTDLSGTRAVRNEHGITLDNAPANTVGGAEPGAGNLLSGNFIGLVISGPSGSGNVAMGNQIGTDAEGLRALPNLDAGLFINGAPGNTIGGPSSAAGNVISGNDGLGIQIFNLGSSGNVVAGNRIGIDRDASRPIPNTGGGVFINDAPANTVGGATPDAGNTISGNIGTGLTIFGQGAIDNAVTNNVIGTPRPGDDPARFGNGAGLFITGVGGPNLLGQAPEQANSIRGNRSTNVLVVGADSGPVVSQPPDLLLDAAGRIIAIRVTFSEDLDARRADNLRNYRLNSGENGDGRPIPIADAAYDPSDHSVTLALGRALAPNESFRLAVVGRPPGGLANRRNIRLDGDADGEPGDNFIARFRNGQFLNATGMTTRTAPGSVSANAVDSLFDADRGLRVARRRP